MASELEILQGLRDDIRKWLGISSNTQLIDSLNNLNKSVQSQILLDQAIIDILTGKTVSSIPGISSVTGLQIKPKKYFTQRNTSQTIINPNSTFQIINASGIGNLFYIWIVIQGHNNFTLNLLVDDSDFSITPDELINYETSSLYINNDWNWTFMTTSPPVFGVRWQGNLPIYSNLIFNVQNNDITNTLTVSQYRFAYEMSL